MGGAGKRVEAVNALITRVGSDLPAATSEGDLDGASRGVYERGLGLPKGALAWDRFADELGGLEVDAVVAQLIGERRTDDEVTAPGDGLATMSPADYLAETFADLGLEPRQTLWLTGSSDVRRALEAVGVVVPLLRSAPSQDQLRSYAVAVMCRGPVGHKVMNPWTSAIERMPQFTGPTLVRVSSSNISGIARSVWEQRVGLKAHVDRWRAER